MTTVRSTIGQCQSKDVRTWQGAGATDRMTSILCGFVGSHPVLHLASKNLPITAVKSHHGNQLRRLEMARPQQVLEHWVGRLAKLHMRDEVEDQHGASEDAGVICIGCS
jgi:hypothetical protein